MGLPKLIALFSILTLSSVSATNSTDDVFALLTFKSHLSDPTEALFSWSDKTHNPCKWFGVTCRNPRNPDRVTDLSLDSLNLTGTISPFLGNLSLLTHLHLAKNKLNGQIPQELGQLQQLRYLNISSNSLEGNIPSSLSHLSNLHSLSFSNNRLGREIPSGLSNCTNLQVLCLDANILIGTIPNSFILLKKLTRLFLNENNLTGQVPPWLGASANFSTLASIDLSSNNLIGQIPASLGSLSSLLLLKLNLNRLKGAIPPSLGNCSSLINLSLGENSLEGSIPDSLARLPNLEVFDVSFNQLSGTIPSSLYNVSSLDFVDLGMNNFVGRIPADIGQTLPRLRHLNLQGNQFEGPIPSSLPNASGIELLDLSKNKFSGVVPPNLGELPYMYQLNLGWNQLVAKETEDWTFLTSLTNCTQLSFLILCHNHLQGKLPRHVANLSMALEWIILWGNQISGNIPSGIHNLESIARLELNHNLLTGAIPDEIGNLKFLQELDLSHNKLSGEIPSSLGSLKLLGELRLAENLLQGVIPMTFGNFTNLMLLNLSYNQLDGFIPKEVGRIFSLTQFLDLSHNSFSGPIPLEIGKLKNLALLDISYNKLSGMIPGTLGDCDVLQFLYLEGNYLEGPIPSQLSNLKGIQEVDLSQNNLSGRIPVFFANISSLKSLNLSFNHFEGRVLTEGIFGNASAIFLHGNSRLCGGDPKLQLPICSIEDSKSSKKILSFPVLVAIIVAICVVLCLCLPSLLAVACCRGSKPRKLSPSEIFSVSEDRYRKVSYAELCKATDGFSSTSLIGSGSFGRVYRGRISGYEKDVAIKVLTSEQRGALKSFKAECEALKNARHRNLAKILTSCSTIDPEGNSFRALVFEFMPNGSLEECLHPNDLENGRANHLSFAQRLNIAVDVASALEYLHHHGDTPIVHCDLKPSNILLDDDMNALVTDFGLARFLSGDKCITDKDPTLTVEIKGSIGYIAPEYGMSDQVSTAGDVYSYGILLLELLTEKKPTDKMFHDGIVLCKFVEMVFPDKILDIVDPQLFFLEKNREGNSLSQSIAKELLNQYLLSVTTIGLWCSREAPNVRPRMSVVVTEMNAIRNAYLERQQSDGDDSELH